MKTSRGDQDSRFASKQSDETVDFITTMVPSSCLHKLYFKLLFKQHAESCSKARTQPEIMDLIANAARRLKKLLGT